ncbi:lytic transglycosylase [Anaerobacillus arseniciselenatis]|uniref:Lytic transglycosylase n=1 Tax=Anaerobacillus arseniciselenatis TaxID=85682 RepID=A0A1S2LJE0_9BACI|nr:transglycosylase SLT domain-containing protein [Anaerobacillus arseniciselenatis]OIJ11585.1 lytic transglycosylase [Anaerobacillus arseniciselenatis]
MLGKLKVVTILCLVVVCVYIVVENNKLQDELTILIEENEEMYVEVEEIKQIVSLDGLTEPVETSYYSWEDSKRLAAKFYDESDGRFPEEWGLFLAEKAKERSIDPYILFELIRVETGGTFDEDTVGPQTRFGRAYGLTQFMENTGPWIAGMADLPYEKDLLFNPYYSIELATVYLDFLYDRYGDWDHALTAYHRGMYGLEQFKNNQGTAKSWYSEEIQEKAKRLEMVAMN